MQTTFKDYFLIAIIFGICIFSFYRLMKTYKKKDYVLFGSSFLLFVVVYLVCISNVNISGNYIAIQKAKKEINRSKDEIVKITSGLIKIAYIISDGSSRVGGMPQKHTNEIKKIQDSLKFYLDSNLNAQIDSTIFKLNEE
jgi:hypothetical protein